MRNTESKWDGDNPGTGEPHKFTGAVRAKILLLTAKGIHITTICSAVGITPPCYHRWARIAAKGTEPFASFFIEVDEAAAEAEVSMVDVIRQCAVDGDWRAAAAFLSRRFPERWQKREQREITGALTITSFLQMITDDVGELPSASELQALPAAITSHDDDTAIDNDHFDD